MVAILSLWLMAGCVGDVGKDKAAAVVEEAALTSVQGAKLHVGTGRPCKGMTPPAKVPSQPLAGPAAYFITMGWLLLELAGCRTVVPSGQLFFCDDL